MGRARRFWVVAHRWAGLTIALFLIVAGSTGSLLAFNEELTDLTAPWQLSLPPVPGARTLDPLTLNAAAARAAPSGYRTEGLRLAIDPHHVLSIGFEPPAGSGRLPLDVSVDPYTGRVVRVGGWGDITQGWDQVMPFIYRLHYKLAIDDYGVWAFGIAALIWTIDCFIGFYLTLPVGRRRWWAHWAKAWRVRTPSPSSARLNFDLHRAGGLWLWPILLVFAWSSVGMNLRQVYDPVMKAVGNETPYAALPDRAAPPGYRPDWTWAYGQAHRLAAAQGITVVHENALFFDAGKNVYSFNFSSANDFVDKGGWSTIIYAPDGQPIKTIIADGGVDEGGLDVWFMALHLAAVGGLPYRIVVSFVGLVVTMLSVTGVVIWMKKRSARLLHQARRSGTLAPAE